MGAFILLGSAGLWFLLQTQPTRISKVLIDIIPGPVDLSPRREEIRALVSKEIKSISQFKMVRQLGGATLRIRFSPEAEKIAVQASLVADLKRTEAQELFYGSDADGLRGAIASTLKQLAVLEVLIRSRNPKDVSDIIQFSEQKSADILRQTIGAVSEIGGHEAAAWLFTLSTGHPDEEIRELSSDALIEVERRLPK